MFTLHRISMSMAFNCSGDVTVSVLASSAVVRAFEQNECK